MEPATLIKYICGGTAVIFFIKFLIGRRLVVKEDEKGIEITGLDGQSVLVPYTIQKEVLAALEELRNSEQKELVVPTLLKQTIRGISLSVNAWRTGQVNKVIRALLEILITQSDMERAIRALRRVPLEEDAKDQQAQTALMRELAEQDVISRLKDRRDREDRRDQISLEMLELDLEQKKRSAQSKNRNRFDQEFGPDDEAEES